MNRRSFLAVIAGAPVVANGLPSATARLTATEVFANAARREREMQFMRVMANSMLTDEQYEVMRRKIWLAAQ